MAALAALIGLIDVFGDAQIRNLSDAWLHAGGNVIAVLIALYNRYSRYEHGTSAIAPTGTVLSGGGADFAVHGLEGLGDGLSPSGWSCRLDLPRRRTESFAYEMSALRKSSKKEHSPGTGQMSARTHALLSRAEAGKMLRVHRLRCVRLSPGGAFINVCSLTWFDHGY